MTIYSINESGVAPLYIQKNLEILINKEIHKYKDGDLRTYKIYNYLCAVEFFIDNQLKLITVKYKRVAYFSK